MLPRGPAHSIDSAIVRKLKSSLKPGGLFLSSKPPSNLFEISRCSSRPAAGLDEHLEIFDFEIFEDSTAKAILAVEQYKLHSYLFHAGGGGFDDDHPEEECCCHGCRCQSDGPGEIGADEVDGAGETGGPPDVAEGGPIAENRLEHIAPNGADPTDGPNEPSAAEAGDSHNKEDVGGANDASLTSSPQNDASLGPAPEKRRRTA